MMHAAPLSAAAERNKQPILEVLRMLLPPQGQALEIACGTGQHVLWFAQHLPQWRWLPTDVTPERFADIAAQATAARLANVVPPQRLDVCQQPWFDRPAAFDLIYCANMLHIAPWACCAALMQGAARHLTPRGQLVTYGPYLEDEVPTAPSNARFDASLRARNPAWGLRRRADVEHEARCAGLQLAQRHAMPANNLLLVWRRAA
jgi:SAM-dependent methyltransferase